jgi:hypothetical protein
LHAGGQESEMAAAAFDRDRAARHVLAMVVVRDKIRSKAVAEFVLLRWPTSWLGSESKSPASSAAADGDDDHDDLIHYASHPHRRLLRVGWSTQPRQAAEGRATGRTGRRTSAANLELVAASASAALFWLSRQDFVPVQRPTAIWRCADADRSLQWQAAPDSGRPAAAAQAGRHAAAVRFYIHQLLL